MTIEELHIYLERYLENEYVKSWIKIAFRERGGEVMPKDIVNACEKASLGASLESLVNASTAVRLCRTYGKRGIDGWKPFLDDGSTVGIVAGAVLEDLWRVLDEDPRGTWAPLASALMISLANGVTFGESRDITGMVRRVMEK